MLLTAFKVDYQLNHQLHNSNYHVAFFLLELAKPRSCNSLWSAGRRLSGEYTVWIDGVTPSYVYCDMDIDGGGWTVIQRRVDESTDFYRGWHEYKQGFGNLSKNFWLGLDAIHNLTERHAVLRIDITDHYGKKAFAKYGRFHIGNESTNYTLSVSGYEGNARDSLTYHNGMGFSTNDTDNDAYSGNCARKFIGAWWYKMCHYSNLNGNMMSWYHLSNKYNTIKYSEMKVRGKLLYHYSALFASAQQKFQILKIDLRMTM